MKIEKLSKGSFIKTSIIVILFISIIGVIFINKSKAKYRVTQSIQIVNGTVNYKVPDLNVLALYKQKTEGDTSESNYESITDVPTGKYVVNTDKSYCTIIGSDTKLKNKMTYNNGEISININKKGTKCYVYLDIDPTMSGTELLATLKVNSTSEGCPNYEDAPSVTSVKSSGSLFCKGKDNDNKDTYYFRGNPTNNWVKIGNFYWRIIRFNGNGSIRLIYSGNGKAETSGTGTQIGTSAYNSLANSAQYVKYDNSTIKGVLDNWYNTNLKSTYGSKMDGEAGFCNDADAGSSYWFKPYDRIFTNKKPTFKCETPTINLYTTSGNSNGNQKLTNPIGLITVDEASFAGGLGSTINNGYYLYTNQDYWTLSPDYYSSGNGAGILSVGSSGGLAYGAVVIHPDNGVRPVINLKADTTFTGEGTSTNPYVVSVQ